MSASRWTTRDQALLAVVAVFSVYTFRAQWYELANEIIRREDNSYIFLVPVVAAYLFWLRRFRTRFIRRRPSMAGCLLLVVAAALAWFGDETDTRVAGHLAAILSLVACVIAFTGLAALRQFLPVALALLFLVPMPGEIRRAVAVVLQGVAVFVTCDVLEIVGIPSERQGNVIIIRDTPILVGEACDGMRMVMALALTYFTFVFSVPLRLGARTFLVLASPVVAIACNLVRLVATGFAYAYSTPEFAESVHDVAGWFMLPLAILLLLGIVRLLRWMDLPVYSWRFLQS